METWACVHDLFFMCFPLCPCVPVFNVGFYWVETKELLCDIDACIHRDMLKWNKSSFLQKLVVAWMRILLTFLISDVSWVLANIMSESSHCFQKGNRNSGRRLCIMFCPSFWEDYYMLIYTHCWELMNSVGGHGSLSPPFMMKVMVCHFVSDSHEVMTVLIVVLPIIVVVDISLQLHQAFMWEVEVSHKGRYVIKLWCFFAMNAHWNRTRDAGSHEGYVWSNVWHIQTWSV